MRWLNGIVFAVLLASSAQAQETTTVVSEAPASLAITIYRDDLALITEKRIIDLPAGRSKIEFAGVSDQMISQTALLQEFGAITLERNFDFDLLTQAALFENIVGKDIVVTRTNPKGKITEKKAKVISAKQGVLVEIDGNIEAFKCAGMPERAGFYDIPSNLKPKPTLSLEVSATKAGPQELTISYLASGFGWQADYLVTLDGAPDKKGKVSARLAGWLTLTNGTAVSFVDAPTAIIAGDLRRLAGTRVEPSRPKYFSSFCWPTGSTKTGTYKDLSRREAKERAQAAPMMMSMAAEAESDTIVVTGSRMKLADMKTDAEREDFGDYKLYRIPNPTTVAANQVKQVRFLNKDKVDLQRFHVFDLYEPESLGGENPHAATVEYHIDNSRKGKLGEPLPQGTFRVMTKTPMGRTFFLGEDYQNDLAVDLPVEIGVSQANDVTMMTTTISATETRGRKGNYIYTRKMKYEFANANGAPVQVKLTLGKDSDTVFNIDKQSMRRDKTEDIPTWFVTLPAETRKTLTMTVRWEY